MLVGDVRCRAAADTEKEHRLRVDKGRENTGGSQEPSYSEEMVRCLGVFMWSDVFVCLCEQM